MKKLRFDLTKDSQWKDFLDRLLTWRDKQVRLTVTVEKYAKRRSTDANAYWWSVVIPPLADHFGYQREEFHRIMCGEFFGWTIKEIRGHKIQCPVRTTTTPDVLDTMTFKSLIEFGQQLAAENGVMLVDEEAA